MQITDRFKSTKGFNAQVVVAKALQYWGDGTKTLATFTAGGIADGTFCFFNANTGVSLPSSAVASTVNIVAGVIRNGKARVTTPFSTATHKVDKAVYAAGVLHQAQVAAPASGTPTVGKEYGILIKDITNSNLSENATYRYSVVATASHSTYALLAAALVAKINSTSSIENSTKDLLVTAAVVNTDDITLTAKKIGQLFTVGVFEEGAVAFTTSITAKGKMGQGTVPQVKVLEEEGFIFEGVTTNYPVHGLPEEYGKPTSLVAADGQYNIYTISGFITKAGKGPINQEVDKNTLVIVADTNALDAARATDDIDVILAV